MNLQPFIAKLVSQSGDELNIVISEYPDVKILVVDDDVHMRGIISTVLRALGFPTQRFAEDGINALELVCSVVPDIIITDIVLPKLNGLELVKSIRNNSSATFNSIPVIVITGHTEEKYVRASLAAGVDQFLSKPITGKSLANRLTRVITEERDYIRTPKYFGPRRNAVFAGEAAFR